jgi:hypothetical protein
VLAATAMRRRLDAAAAEREEVERALREHREYQLEGRPSAAASATRLNSALAVTPGGCSEGAPRWLTLTLVSVD